MLSLNLSARSTQQKAKKDKNEKIGTKATNTNEEGRYIHSDLKNGLTTIKVTMSGFADLKKELEISGSTVSDFQLEEKASNIDEIVVTGVVRSATKLQSSVSVSSISGAQIELAAPRATAEIFRSIPGIIS